MRIISMINTSYNTYHYAIPYQKPQSQMKDLRTAMVLTEKNDGDNNVYRNAAAKATEIADIDRYSQGTFDLSLLVAGRNAESYFTGTMSSIYDVDYFHVDTSSQILSRRPVIINMEMPEGADYDLTVYDDKGNQVGMAVLNEDGTKTLTIPCDWSNCCNFVIKISQHNPDESIVGSYKLTFAQGDMPQETIEWLEHRDSAFVIQTTQEERIALGQEIKRKYDAKNAEGISALHRAQYDALPEELKYTGNLSASELIDKEKNGGRLSEAEKAYVAIYGNQNEIFQAESIQIKYRFEQEFADFLKSIGFSAGESFEIHLNNSETVEISGVDEEWQKQIEDYVTAHWDVFKNIYLSTSEETAEMTDGQYRIAGYVDECNRFLAKASGGTISVEDLTLQLKQAGKSLMISEEITGLPGSVAQFINGADSTSAFYDYKQMLKSILEYRRLHGEIPQYHMNFVWNGHKFSK